MESVKCLAKYRNDMHLNWLYTIFYACYFRKRYKQSYLKLMNFLSESQYWSRDKMREFQDEQLADLTKIMERTEYYSQLLEDKQLESINASNIESLGFLSKEMLKRCPQKLQNGNINEYSVHKTSGTGGVPLQIRVSVNAEAYRTAGRKRFYQWWGIESSDRSVLIWGRSGYKSNKQSLMGRFEKLSNAVLNRVFYISVFDLSKDMFPFFIKKIRRYKPAYFRGYTSGIEQFADLCIEYGKDLIDLKIKGVIVTSEILSQNQRKKITSVFGCPVINEYGANDGGLIAFECPSGSMHIFEEAILLKSKPNGEVLLTDLHNYATPLINYELGDRIQFKEGYCSCGCRLKMIGEIEGRTGDLIQKSNGQVLNNAFFAYLMNDLDNIGYNDNLFKYKVIQKGKIFEFYYIKGKLFSSDVLIRIKEIMNSEIGEDIEIIFKEVREIKREESGKLRYFFRES